MQKSYVITKMLFQVSEKEYREQVSSLQEQEARTLASTELYKNQYEQLLHEYNQYLEDLEKMQVKIKDLESVKRVLEDESSHFEETTERLREECTSLVTQLAEAKAKLSELESSGGKVHDLEQALVWEKQASHAHKAQSVPFQNF